MIYKVKNLDETKKVAIKFATSLSIGDVVLFNGDLGAGKTTFIKFVLEYLGVKEIVSSPTFAILKQYVGKFNFNHFDTYRINTPEAIEAGFDEIISKKDCVTFIEWAENISELLPKKFKTVNIKRTGETTREIEINE